MCKCLTLIGVSMKDKPIILLIVTYQYRRRSDSGSEATGTMYSVERQTRIVREELNCQHQAVWKLGCSDKVNSCELQTSIVTIAKPKMLIGFTKRCVGRISCSMLMIRRQISTGVDAEPKLLKVTYTKHGKPVFFPGFLGKEIVRDLNRMQVKEDRRSKCHSVMEWIKVETLPCTKVSRLLSGLCLRESMKNLYMEESK